MYRQLISNSWKACLLFVCVFFSGITVKADDSLYSPNKKIGVSWDNPVKGLRVIYKKGDVPISVVQLENIGLQLQRASGDEFNYVSSSAVTSIREDYTMITGKRRHCTNEGNQQVFHFENGQNVSLDLELRVYDDGIAFRYVFPQPTKEICVTDENTAFVFQEGITRWTQKLNQAYEDFYLKNKGRVQGYTAGQWGFPALFEVAGSVFTLISEANVAKGNCGSWLNNASSASSYKVEMAEPTNVSGRWCSPWRVAIIGSLADVVESTLVTDVSEPCRLSDVSWIKPGVVSWIYWAYNHGSRDYQIIKKYIDFAADFHLPYMLIDAEWDEMGNGGNVEDALAYAKQKNIAPLLWYNSSTAWCAFGPLYRLNKPEMRQKEFAWLESMGVKGIKVDFFSQDSISTMNYVVGPMDYTPCTFTDSQHPHITSNGHELALLVAFESALQHLADRPEGYHAQPAEIRSFISSLPTVWDDTKLLSGYPSSYVVLARKSGDCWYIAGLNGTNGKKSLAVDLSFIQEPVKEITLYADGKERNQFDIQMLSGLKKAIHEVDCLPRGGFVMKVQMKN